MRTVRELRDGLATADAGEWARLVGKIMREARDEDVWKFVTPEQVWQRFAAIEPYLGNAAPRVEGRRVMLGIAVPGD